MDCFKHERVEVLQALNRLLFAICIMVDAGSQVLHKVGPDRLERMIMHNSPESGGSYCFSDNLFPFSPNGR